MFLYLNGREIVVWLLLCGHPIWLLSDNTCICTVRATLIKIPLEIINVIFLIYLVYACTQNEVAFFIPLKGKDGTFVLAECAGQVTCGHTKGTKSMLKLQQEDIMCLNNTKWVIAWPKIHCQSNSMSGTMHPATRWLCCSRID